MKVAYNFNKDPDDFNHKIETIKNAAAETYLAEYVVSIKEEREYCVGRVDIINFNKITALIGSNKTVQYCQLFLNAISYVLEHFGGYVIKNIEGSMLYYFPESGKKEKTFGFMSCIECGLAMIEIQEDICKIATRQGLPKMYYSISADYGKVTVISSDKSDHVDLFGSPMNMCSKINHKASPNEFVIGKDLYEIVKNYNCYNFRESKKYSNDFECNISVYTVARNQKIVSDNNV